MSREPVIDYSGNVFADLGFSAEESTLLAMRAELMTRLRDHNQTTRLDAARSSRETGYRPIPRIRPDAWQMGKIQPGYANYIDHPHRTACGVGFWVRVIEFHYQRIPGTFIVELPNCKSVISTFYSR